MSAVWMSARAALRGRARALISLALLVGLGGGGVLATIAGARRTDTAYPRLVEQMHGAHAGVGVEYGGRGASIADVQQLPGVVAIQEVNLYVLVLDEDACDGGNGCIVGSAPGRTVGGPVDEHKLVAGRLADPTNPGEVVLTVEGRGKTSLRIGSTFPLASLPPYAPFFERFGQAVKRDPLLMTVVGVVAAPGDFPPQLGDESVQVHLTRAFFERYPEPAFGLDDLLMVRLQKAGDATAFRDAVIAASPEDGEQQGSVPLNRVRQDANVQRGLHLQAQALLLLGLFGAVAVVLVVAQSVAREIFLGADQMDALSALGMSRRQRALVAWIRAGVIATVGGILAVAVSAVLSPLFPIGLARDADPSTGFSLDVFVLGLGGLAIIGAVTLLALIPSWRAARVDGAGLDRVVGRDEPSVVADAASRAGLAPAGVTGIRLALQRGHGRAAVPVRATLAGLVVGIGALAAAGTFGSSLDHLLATPRLYGVPWDLLVGSEGGVDFRTASQRLLSVPGVKGVAIGKSNLGFLVGGEEVEGLGLDSVRGGVTPPVLEGSAPNTDASKLGEPVEMVLGSKTLARLRLSVGDAFTFTVPGAVEEPVDAIVVGRGVIPTSEDATPIGDAAWLSTPDFMRAVGLPDDHEFARADRAFIDLEPGVAPATVFDRLPAALGVKDDLWLPPGATPSDLVNFGRVQNLPSALAGVLTLFAAGVLAHTLLTSIRRRRRDIAILKTLGFSRAQVRGSVAMQASILASVASLIGVPAGLVAGRWLWTAYAESQGFIPEAVFATWSIIFIVPVSIVIANLLAILPGRAAARTQPAVVLRTE